MAGRDLPSTPATERTQRKTSRIERQNSPPRDDEEDSPNGVERSRNAINEQNRASNAGLSKASRHSLAAPSTVGDDAEEPELDVQYDDEVDESLIQEPEMSSPVLPTKRLNGDKSKNRLDDSPGPQEDYPEQAGDGSVEDDEQEAEPMQAEDDGPQSGEEDAPQENSPPVRAKAKKGKGKADSKSSATTKRKPLADATNKRKTKAARRDPDDDEDESGGDSGHARKRSKSAKVIREPVHKRESRLSARPRNHLIYGEKSLSGGRRRSIISANS